MSREEKSFRGKTRRKNEKGRGTLARLYSKLISSPPFRLNPTYFSSFRFCRGSSTIRYAAEFFRVKRICSPRITFPSGNIFVSISLSLSLRLCFLRARRDTIRSYGCSRIPPSLSLFDRTVEEDVEKRKRKDRRGGRRE